MKDKNAILAGGFILLAVFLVAGVIVSVRGLSSLFEEKRDYLVVFDVSDDIGGLRSGSEVRVGGLKAGSVSEVQFDTESGEARVTARFSLPERIPLGPGAMVAVQSTITGVSWLNVDDLGDISEPLGPDDPIAGRPNTLTQLLASFSDLTPQVQGVITDIRQQTLPRVNDAVDAVTTLATETNGEIKSTVAPVRDAATDASALMATLNEEVPPAVDEIQRFAGAGADVMEQTRGILGEGGDTDIKTTLTNVAGATGTLKERLPQTMDKIDAAVDKTSGQLDKVAAVLDDMRGVAGNLNETIGNNRPRIDRILGNVREASETFKLAMSEIRRSPWRLLYRPDKSESEQLDLYDAARRFAEGANELSAAADALRAASESGDAKRVDALLDRVESKLGDFNEAERGLYEKLR